MAAVSATVLTDPYSPWSWAAEPQLRRLQVEFGDSVAFTFVIVGLHRRIEAGEAALAVGAELWRLALEWRVKPRRVPGGELWEVA